MTLRFPLVRQSSLILVAAVWLISSTTGLAGPKSQAAKEAAEYLLRKFGKEAATETAETLAARIESLAIKYGDDVIAAARRAGPRGLRAVERAGAEGNIAARLLGREGDKALWIVEHPQRLKLFTEYGDEAAAAMLKHKAVAEPVIAAFHKPAARALQSLDGRNARRLAMMADSGELARLGHSDALLDVIARYGNRGMDFIWRNKKQLAVAGVLAAFLANPEPFIDGTADLATGLVRPVAESVGGEVARRTDWNRFWLAALAALVVYGLVRFWLRERLRALRRPA